MPEPSDVPFGMHETNLAPWERPYAKRLDEPMPEPDEEPITGRVQSPVTECRPTDESATWVECWPYTVHVLKTWQPYFSHVKQGWKRFEIRSDDRGFKPGDLLVLAEWDGEDFTGQDCVRVVRYVLRDAEQFGLMPGYVALDITPADKTQHQHYRGRRDA